MFRSMTHNRGGYGQPIAQTSWPSVCEFDVVAAPEETKLNRVPPGGYSVKPYVDEYKKEAAAVKLEVEKLPDKIRSQYGPLIDSQRDWADVHTNQAKALKVARGALDILAQEKQAAAMFNIAPTAVMPTGAAAQTAYADYARITALMNQLDFARLVIPDNVSAIAKGVTKTVSTPLFSAFVAFMRQPPPPLAPQQQSKAMFIELVRRAVMMNNAGVTWEDITGPVNAIPVADSVPVAQAVPVDEKGGGFAAFDGFPQPKP